MQLFKGGSATKNVRRLRFLLCILCMQQSILTSSLIALGKPSLRAALAFYAGDLLFILTPSQDPMFARQRLKTRGYLVLYHAVPVEMTDTKRAMAEDGEVLWIHDTWDGVLHDEHRLRARVPDNESEPLSEYFERHYRSFFAMASVKEWRILRTTRGAEDQPVRREFATARVDSGNVSSVPGCIFVAAQDRTYIYGYGWNNHVALRSEQQIIELNRGDVLLSRGDFAFASAGGNDNHVGLLGYVDTPLYLRPQFPQPIMVAFVNDTSDVDDVFCFVWNCPFRGTDPDALRRHLNRYHQFFFNRSRVLTV